MDLSAGEADLTDLTDRLDTLIAAANRADAIAPLGEHVLLCLHRGDHPDHHRVRFSDTGALVGYLHLEPGPDGPVVELVVHPTYRRRGHGRALLTEELDAVRAAGATLRAWSHGGLRPARALARELDLRPARELWTMARPLDVPLPDPALPEGVLLRSFRPGEDDAAWVALNALAFADHPEQGRWQQSDLRDRIAAAWFDAEGFLVAERDGRMVGYHWTKVHREDDAADEPVGEVYVVGVDPAEQGHGLGRALTVAGLRHLAAQGLGTATLYVEESNAAARKVYESLGFAHSGTDVMYATSPG